MRHFRYISAVFCVMFGSVGQVLAQAPTDTTASVSDADALQLRAAVREGVVYLRWVPATSTAYYGGSEAGYRVERKTGNGDYAELPGSPVRHACFEEVYALGATDQHAPLLAMAMRPDSLVGAPDGPNTASGAVDTTDRRRSLIGLGLLGTIMSREVAYASGTFLADSSGVGEAVRYRVTSLANSSITAEIDVDASRNTPLPASPALEAEWGDRRVELSFEWPADRSLAYVTVYGRNEDSTEYRALSAGPIFPNGRERFTLTDSLVDNETTYEYALLGADYFHAQAPTQRPVAGRGVPALAMATPFITEVVELVPEEATVRWEPDGSGPAEAIVRQRVSRALSPDGPYAPIATDLPGTARSFTDTVILRDEQYYRVTAFDARGRTRTSAFALFILRDTTPPEPPQGLEAEVDYAGVLSLTWAQHLAPDVEGYRVFYSTNREAPGTRVTPYSLRGRVFVDTLHPRSMPDSVYYRVVALDERENASGFSEALAVAIPDWRAPFAVTLTQTVNDTNGISVRLVPSYSDDVVRYVVLRRALGTALWMPIDEVAPAALEGGVYRDTLLGFDLSYEYRVDAFDEAGNRAVSNVVSGKRVWNYLLPAVRGLTAKLDPDAQRMVLQWRYGKDDRLRRFRIYRALKGQDLRTYELISSEDLPQKGPNRRDGTYLFRYYDEGYALGEEYSYAVQAEWADGSRSRLK